MHSRMNPMDAKKSLAREIVARFHSEEAAQRALQNFVDVFSKKGVPEKMDEYTVNAEESGSIWICKALANIKVVKSTSDAKRLLEQGGLYIDNERISDPKYLVGKGSYVVKVGKKLYVRLNVI